MTTENTLTPEHVAFHAHLDTCTRCREHPFAMCPVGDAALKTAAAAAAKAMSTTLDEALREARRTDMS